MEPSMVSGLWSVYYTIRDRVIVLEQRNMPIQSFIQVENGVRDDLWW